MIRLQRQSMHSISDVRAALQKAIQLEFSTLPPYLYALFTLRDGTNAAARRRITAVVRDEMVHLGLACNILNAIGGSPHLAEPSVLPAYPGPLPYAIGADGGQPFEVSLLPFSEDAMRQAMQIEEPEEPLVFPGVAPVEATVDAATFETIGQFYTALETALLQLPGDAWSPAPRNQLHDHPFFAGDLMAVIDGPSASVAIRRIVSEGEGTRKDPLDFEGEVAHYYRFEEVARDQALRRDPLKQEGYSWGGSIGVDWDEVADAIADPGLHDFSDDRPALAAQQACDSAFKLMVNELQRAVNGESARLGNAVRAMFELRQAARVALATPLRGSQKVAGPAFRYRP